MWLDESLKKLRTQQGPCLASEVVTNKEYVDNIGGNQEPWEFAKKIGDQLALIGGLDLFSVLTNGTKEALRAKVHELFEKVGHNGGYICAASDHFFETPLEKLKAFADAARECVY